jgi:RimJ/RimL family protein N-acetyltransferase
MNRDLLSAVSIRTSRLVVRVPSSAELAELAAVSVEGVASPVGFPSAAMPLPERVAAVVAYHDRCDQVSSRDMWQVNLVAVLDGQVVGSQSVSAVRFPQSRCVSTGSWIGSQFAGVGLEVEMRAAALVFAQEVGAESAESRAVLENMSARGVSAMLGYRHVENVTVDVAGVRRTVCRSVLDLATWPRPDGVTAAGVDVCRPLFV